jgi:hypothetical protein
MTTGVSVGEMFATDCDNVSGKVRQVALSPYPFVSDVFISCWLNPLKPVSHGVSFKETLVSVKCQGQAIIAPVFETKQGHVISSNETMVF